MLNPFLNPLFNSSCRFIPAVFNVKEVSVQTVLWEIF
jgi:hypothetical protein